ncbi:MAG: tetratricopeptide repeat protein [Azospirillum sp.]|nr:tetratricopeptide repeat protein [Azospirillum sp.]
MQDLVQRPQNAVTATTAAITTNPGVATPGDAVTLQREGLRCWQDGDRARGLEMLRQATLLAPRQAEFPCNLAIALRGCGRLDEAANSFREALALAPDLVEAQFGLGNVLCDLGRFHDAIACFERAAALDPNHIGAQCNLGVALGRSGDPAQAESVLRQALALDSDHPDALKALGDALRQQGRLDEAIAAYRKVLARDPGDAGAHRKLGLVLADRRQLDGAVAEWRAAVTAAPDDPANHCCLALGLLGQGKYPEGFAEYEWRRRLKEYQPPAAATLPDWDGGPLQGRTVLVFTEQGYGDTVQFARFLPMLAERGGRAVLLGPPSLLPLLRRLPGVAAAAGPGGALPSADLQAALPSLPKLLGLTAAELRPQPYLTPDPSRRARWRERLGPQTGLRVGVVWAGNPRHSDDRKRSLPPELLGWLPQIEGVTWFGLQLGENGKELSRLGPGAIDLAQEIDDFEDTAAVLAELDLLVTVDTAAAHLAGALGRPVWVLLAYAADWRWQLESGANGKFGWYPSARLYRQQQPGDWDEVMQRLGGDLCRLAGQLPPTAPATWEQAVVRLHGAGRSAAAEAVCWSALQEPGLAAAALRVLGSLRLQRDDARAAIRLLTVGLMKGPAIADSWSNLGVALRREGRYAESEHAYRRAIELAPEAVNATFNLANLLNDLGRWEQTLPLYQRVLAREPAHVGAHYNSGNALRDLGRLDEAIAAYRRGLVVEPDNAEIHNSLGMGLLLAGRFHEGWREYEWRWQCGRLPPRGFTQPVWDGTPLAGRTLLVYAEQGLGDAIQFLRYLPLIERAGAGRIILELPTALVELGRRLPNLDLVVEHGAPLPPFDCHAALIGLAGILGTRLHNLPDKTPYLVPRPDRLARWQARFGSHGKFRVGLVWAGNPRHKNDHRRSIPLAAFKGLPLGPGISYYSLQLGERRGDLAREMGQAPIIDLGPLIKDFDDTAAVMAELDLIVTCDTAVAHLAGALGRPVWVLLPIAPDWRWLLLRADSPWYPTMRLIRQNRRDDWSQPVAEVAADLHPIAAGGSLESLFVEAEALAAHGDQDGAAVVIRRLQALWPGHDAVRRLQARHTEADLAAARAAAAADDRDTATRLFQKILSVAPGSMAAHAEYGMLCQKQKRHAEAIASFEHLARRMPKNASVHYNLGLCLQLQGRLDEAEECLRLAIEHQPDLVDAYNDLGTLLYRCGRLDEAHDCLKRCLGLRPGHVNALGNLTVVLRSLGRFDEAIGHTRAALAMQPDTAELHWNFAVLLLMAGRFEEGWRESEWRWKMPNFPSPPRNFLQPQWQGEPLEGRTILLHGEQGLGDTLQFVRYVPMVAARGARIVLEVQPPLLELCRGLPGVAELRALGTALPPFDLHAPLLSLPAQFDTRLGRIPAEIPYLQPPAAAARRWAERLPKGDSFKVGLVWGGSVTHANDRNRSVPFRRFERFRRITGVTFHALQKGPATLQAATKGSLAMVDLGPALGDFAETAAAVAQLDLVITVDTSVAHLAGAIGRPVWVMIPFPPDWRWLTEREDTPWYPTMRLFRQTRPGDWEEVIERVATALERLVHPPAPRQDPAFAAALALQVKGRGADAERAYRKIVQRNPRHAEAYHHLGLLALAGGRRDDAERQIRKALDCDPDLAGAWSNLGVVLRGLNRLDEAIGCYRRAVALQPEHVDALYNLANALKTSGAADEAIGLLRRAVDLRPGHGGAWNNLGLALKDSGRLGDAETVLRRALTVTPGDAMATANLGLVLHDLERDAEAVALCEPAAAKSPDSALLQRVLAMVLKAVDRLDEALAACDRSLRLEPGSAETWHLRASALVSAHRLGEARHAVEKALAIEPGYPEAQWTQGFLDLVGGDLAHGFERVEARWRIKKICPNGLRFTEPVWDGGRLDGRTVLVHAEQGLGDTLNFVRYLPQVVEAGGQVVVEAQETLHPLIGTLGGKLTLVAPREALPRFDCHIPLMSLPRVFGTTLDTVPAPVPYLVVDPGRRARWAERLGVPRGRRVGLVWAGNPKHANDRNRSIRLKDLAPVLQVPGVKFVSVQKGSPAGQIADWSGPAEILDLDPEINDFADTAAILADLDLLISVDTAVAHCAGGLGVPVWVLLPQAPDWRWLLDRSDSPWYPSLRLYRQLQAGDWQSVIARVASDLAAL